jgi:hypothetical protein
VIPDKRAQPLCKDATLERFKGYALFCIDFGFEDIEYSLIRKIRILNQ